MGKTRILFAEGNDERMMEAAVHLHEEGFESPFCSVIAIKLWPLQNKKVSNWKESKSWIRQTSAMRSRNRWLWK